jgi:NadR type nicotinamide-nucleotide adenylyltransferase
MPKPERAPTRGLTIGKFMPPHKGHAVLIDFARRFCDELVVLVCQNRDEAGMPVEDRAAWLREMFGGHGGDRGGGVRVVTAPTADHPDLPGDHADFWQIWRATIEEHAGRNFDYVFAGEDYGAELARRIGAGRAIPVPREHFAVSASPVRDNIHAHWQAILPPARDALVRRVAVMGSESAGKTTLAAALAERFGTVWAPEFARPYIDANGHELDESRLAEIVRGQIAMERALARHAARHALLVTDTAAATTLLWSRILHGRIPPAVARLVERAPPPNLILMLSDNVPFAPDPQRYGGGRRQADMQDCMQALPEALRRRVVQIDDADWDARLDAATKAVETRFPGLAVASGAS